MIIRFLLAIWLLLLGATAFAGVTIQSGTSGNLADVNTNSSLRVVEGRSTKTSYVASVGAQATTAAITLSLEAPATQTVYISRVCTSGSVATAAAAVNVTVQRTTTASSGGTALTAEGTSTTAIAKLDPADGNYAGVGRLGGTPGTSGAMIGQWGYTTGELGAGVSDPSSMLSYCREFGVSGVKPIVISAGVSNGVIVTVSSHGAGGLASGAITVVFYVE